MFGWAVITDQCLMNMVFNKENTVIRCRDAVKHAETRQG